MLPNKLAVPLETFCQKEPARLLLRACTVSRLEVRLDPNAIQRDVRARDLILKHVKIVLTP